MKKQLPILTLLLIFWAITAYSQNPVLNKYTFGEGLRFTGKNAATYNITGYMQPSLEIKKYVNDTPVDPFLRFRMRRLRLRLSGDLPKYKIEYRFQADFSGTPEIGDSTNLALFDAWVSYKPTSFLEIKFGQSSNVTENLEMQMGSQTLQLPERSRLTSAFAVAREFGVFVSGEFKATSELIFRPALSVTNGDGPNTFREDIGGFKYGARLDILTFGKFTNLGQFRQADVVRELTPKLVFGFTYSTNIGVSSRRGEANGDILYLDSAGNYRLPNYTKFGFDFLFKYRGFSLLGEFVQSKANVPVGIATRVRNDGSTSNTFLVNGVQNVEDYVKERMMLGRGVNIQGGYLFRNKFSVDARYTSLNADASSFLNNPTVYNRPKYYTLGVSKYLSRGYGFKIQASITYVELGQGSLDINRLPITGNEWITNIITTFSF
ncbi:MAG: porin [Bacteroidetes bacterium]|nr:MAG: porin [Bacteroidota bacterium]